MISTTPIKLYHAIHPTAAMASLTIYYAKPDPEPSRDPTGNLAVGIGLVYSPLFPSGSVLTAVIVYGSAEQQERFERDISYIRSCANFDPWYVTHRTFGDYIADHFDGYPTRRGGWF